MSEAAESRAGVRVLVVEDSAFLAVELEEILEDAGFTVVGPAPSLQRAWALLDDAELDAAVLDVHLDGETAFSLADELQTRGVPLVFATGYDSNVIPDRFNETPRLAKPFSAQELTKAIDRLLAENAR